MNNFKHTTQVILSKLGQGIILWFGFFAVAGVAFAAITWPSTLPDGESDGGTFATILKQVLENTDLTDATNTGTVKYARDSDKVDGYHASDLLAADGGGGWSAASSVVVLAWHQTCPTWFATFQISAWGECIAPVGIVATFWTTSGSNPAAAASAASADGKILCWLNGTNRPSVSDGSQWASYVAIYAKSVYSSITISSGDQTVCIKD